MAGTVSPLTVVLGISAIAVTVMLLDRIKKASAGTRLDCSSKPKVKLKASVVVSWTFALPAEFSPYSLAFAPRSRAVIVVRVASTTRFNWSSLSCGVTSPPPALADATETDRPFAE